MNSFRTQRLRGYPANDPDDLPTANWKAAKLYEPKADYRSAVIILNKESLAALEKTQGEINYGFSAVTLKVYKKDADKPKEQL